MNGIPLTVVGIALILALGAGFGLGFGLGWRKAIRRILTENEDLFTVIEK